MSTDRGCEYYYRIPGLGVGPFDYDVTTSPEFDYPLEGCRRDGRQRVSREPAEILTAKCVEGACGIRQ